MAVTKQRKQEILQELIDLFKESKSVVATKFTGTSVNDINDLRGVMFGKNIRLKVAKKTLIHLAAKEAGYPEVPDSILEGPIALAFSLDDEIAAAKAIKDASKDFDTLGLMGGFMDGKVLSKADITQLADIPPYEVLIAQLLRAIKAPISGFHGVLHGTLRNFVGVLNAIKEAQPTAETAPAVEAVSEPEVTEAPAAPVEAEAPAPAEEPEVTEAPETEA